MAIVLIEENNDIKGYFAIKGNSKDRSLEYHIENQSNSENIQLDIFYVMNNRGVLVKRIKDKNFMDRKICKGSVKDILTFLKEEEQLSDEGVCILDENKNVVFAEYLGKKKLNIKDITIEEQDFDIDNDISNTSLMAEDLEDKENNAVKKKLKPVRCRYKVKLNQDNKPPIGSKDYLLEDSKILEFTKRLSEKATTVKKTKIYSKEDLVIKIPYFLFKDAFKKDNEYFLIVDSIVNLFKDNIKKYGHFLISIIFKRNGEIKYIQIGIPDKDTSLSLNNLNSLKYKQISESNSGYWFYKYEL